MTAAPEFYLIAPRSAWHGEYSGIEGTGGRGAYTRVASLAIATVAALAPADMAVALCDDEIEAVDYDTAAKVIGITANVSQVPRALEIARRFHDRGRTVVIGGPHASLDPDAFAGACDCLVVGEFEAIAPAFFDDLRAGRLAARYEGGRPDLASSPQPRWELYRNDRALMGVVQTSRGCPFECDFCDVIAYLGRKQRHKDTPQVIAEIQHLYDLGYNRIVLADDNFTVYRRRTRELLDALADWNGHDGRDFVIFATQTSLDITADEDILDRCAEAGLLNLFLGIETVNQESLRSSKKRQNLGVDVPRRLAGLARRSLRVEAALMVGFDHDGPDIFQRQLAFGMSLPVGTFKVSVLVAPVATPLHDQMQQAGRIVSDELAVQFPGSNLVSNIRPARMSREELAVGARWLISRLFRPEAFIERLDHIVAVTGPNPLLARGARAYNPPQRRGARQAYLNLLRQSARQDAGVARAIETVRDLARHRPELAEPLQDTLTSYLFALSHYRVAGSYDSAWAEMASPPLVEDVPAPAAIA